MISWWDGWRAWWKGFFLLLFKHASLLGGQAVDAVGGYLDILRRVTCAVLRPLAFLVLVFLASLVFGIKWPWLYPALLLLIAGGLLVIIVVAWPVLVLTQAVYTALPDALKNASRAWQRRGGAILFGSLLAVVLILDLRLWQSPGTMLNVLLIVGLLWVGSCFGWLRVSDRWRTLLSAKLQMTLVVIAIVALLPGPAALVEELAGWLGKGAETAVRGWTQRTPDRWNPASADELLFVGKGLWYYRGENGVYELYKSDGVRLGTPLKRAQTEEEFTAIRNWQLARDREREMARVEQAQLAAAKSAAELAQKQERDRIEAAKSAAALAQQREMEQLAQAERARKAEQLRLASYVVALPSTRVNYIVFIVDSVGRRSSELNLAVVDRLAQRKDVSVVGNVFGDAFASPQGFDAIVAGKGAADLGAMRIGEAADRLLLVRGCEERSVPGSSFAGLRTYSMLMTVSLVDARNGKRLREFVISDVTGAGLTEPAAKAAFSERFAERLAGRNELLEGLH